ncbi:HTH DNA binding protein [Mycobacterium phage LilMcDreamy]|uniref:Helix-turn-helix DNA binding domain protein n=1 Tax=Mycobacterium phage LilMcDreamy TaxID=2652422 RepID=A0A5P8D898_9CAUD|nr:HTH DNA binding protein [Mycobacterium phage LilMcDreamy]QFP94662.1 helix-turn-helix DNA binding domain protein [Mycobacterium phage LilMcDreamy]
MNPETYTTGLGEAIAAHRAYMGLSQRGMARRLGTDRRDYQRIEQGRDACPPGFLDKVTTLVDHFDNAVDSLIEHARERGGAEFEVRREAEAEWERNIAYRALVLGSASDAPVSITLTVVGELEREAS